MYVKKRMSLLLFAALAMVLFTACGRWDFSREAAKAANEAQNAVVFEASTTLAQSLKDALEDKVKTADVKAAMEADERLADLLGRLDVYAVEGDDAEAAAQTIADGYIKHISGRKSDGHIAMVKADNGYFYAAVVTTTTGGSGSGSGSGTSSDDGDGTTTPDPEEPGAGEGGEEQPGIETKYTVFWGTPENGTITVKTSDGNVTNGDQVAEGTKITITASPESSYYRLVKVTVTADGKTEEIKPESDNYTYTVKSSVNISATFEERKVGSVQLKIPQSGFDVGDSIFYDRNLSSSILVWKYSSWLKLWYVDINWEKLFTEPIDETFRTGLELMIYDTEGELIETISDQTKLQEMVDNETLAAKYKGIILANPYGFVIDGKQDVAISYKVDGTTVEGVVKDVPVTLVDHSKHKH